MFFYFGIWDIQEFWDMGYFGRFILGYGILPTPLTKPRRSALQLQGFSRIYLLFCLLLGKAMGKIAKGVF